MITTGEYAVYITIWAMTLAGAFFCGRAAWRRRKQRNGDEQKSRNRLAKGT